jgi:streptogramin lyase
MLLPAPRSWLASTLAVLSCSLLALGSGAVELQPDDLVIAEQGGAIWRVDPSTGAAEVIYQGDLLPRAGIVQDRDQTLLFTAASNDPNFPSHSVVRLDAETGDALVVSGDGVLGPSAYDLAVGSDGLTYVAGGPAGVILVDPVTGTQGVLASPPAIIEPFGIAFDGTGGLWIAEFAPGAAGVQLARVDPQNGQQLLAYTIDACVPLRNARLIATDGPYLLLNCSAESTAPPGPEASSILRVDGATGTVTVESSAGLLADPYGIAVERSGDVVVADSGRVVRVAPGSGTQSLVASIGATGVTVIRAACEDGFDNDADGLIDFPNDPECAEALDLEERENPCGDRIDNDGDGLIDYPDDPGCRNVRSTTESPSCNDGVDNDADGSADLADPDCSAPWVRPERPLTSGDIVVVDRASRTLVRLDPSSGLQESLAELGYLESPTGVALAPDRHLLVADPGAGTVLRIDADGKQNIRATAGLLTAPRDLAVETSGDLVVADEAAGSVVRVNPDDGSQELVSLLGWPPASIALESSGTIVVSDPSGARIVRIEPSAGSQEVVTSGSLLTDPRGISVGPGGQLVSANGSPGSLVAVDPVSGSQVLISSGSLLDALGGVAATPAGQVLTTNSASAMVVRVPIEGGTQQLVGQAGFLVEPLGLHWVLPSCNDSFDNDGDGLVDHPLDPGCDDSQDDSERSPFLLCDDGVDNDGDGLADYPSDPGCDLVTDASERSEALVCDDGTDNDGDLANDFPADPGCDGPIDASERNPDVACDDALDNDSDGLTDFPGDPGCEGPGSMLEDPDCEDGVDNDDDDFWDFPDDPGCDAFFDQDENSILLPCDDGIDNDEDGLLDVGQDPGCTDISDSSEWEASLACDDGIDNDGDGLVDHLEDPSCGGSEAGSEGLGTACDDGVDNDGDGLTDYPADPSCEAANGGSEQSVDLPCDDGLDNDADGLVDFPTDQDCLSLTWPVEISACSDGNDNDGDGLTDFPADPGCVASFDLTEADEGPACSNGVDDDGDGLVDLAADPGCDTAVDPSERGALLICDNGLDDDGDGAHDYPADPGCDAATDASEVGTPGASAACDDGTDNDGDGLADHPGDPGCAGPGDSVETTPFVACDDAADNDTDGQVDFPDDSDCADPRDATEGVVADSQPPVASSPSVAVGETRATVVWSTDEPARSRVEYGPTSALGQTAENLAWETTQRVLLEGLSCDQTYVLAASSEDPSGNASSGYLHLFTTLPCGSDRALEAHWRFEEGGGTEASDSSGGGSTGTLLGPLWRAETVDGSEFALDFDGSDDFVDVGALDVEGQALTIAVWMKPDSFTGPARDGRLVSKSVGTSDDDHFWMLSTFADGDDTRLRFRVRAGGTTKTLVATSGNVTPGDWIHAAAVYDGSEMRLYQNGIGVGVGSKQGVLDTNPGVAVAIGNQPLGAGSKPFDGLIDEVQIYSRALSPAEIIALYGNQATAVTDLGVTLGSGRATLAWRTDQASTTSLEFGLTPGYENGAVTHDFLTTRHGVGLTGLQAETLYYYRLASTTQGGVVSVREASFVTPQLEAVPALGAWGGLVLAALLTTTGVLSLRQPRRRTRDCGENVGRSD